MLTSRRGYLFCAAGSPPGGSTEISRPKLPEMGGTQLRILLVLHKAPCILLAYCVLNHCLITYDNSETNYSLTWGVFSYLILPIMLSWSKRIYIRLLLERLCALIYDDHVDFINCTQHVIWYTNHIQYYASQIMFCDTRIVRNKFYKAMIYLGSYYNV